MQKAQSLISSSEAEPCPRVIQTSEICPWSASLHVDAGANFPGSIVKASPPLFDAANEHLSALQLRLLSFFSSNLHHYLKINNNQFCLSLTYHQTITHTQRSHKMATEDFQQIMARLRAREQALDDEFDALEDEFRLFRRDQRRFRAAVEAAQESTPDLRQSIAELPAAKLPIAELPGSVPQHPVAEALNTFGSTQMVVALTSAPVPTTVQNDGSVVDDGESLFIPEQTGILRQETYSEKPPTEESTDSIPSRPKRRVTFAEADIIMGGMTPAGAPDDEVQSSSNESVGLKIPSDDAHIGYTQLDRSGNERPGKRARYHYKTPKLMYNKDSAPSLSVSMSAADAADMTADVLAGMSANMPGDTTTDMPGDTSADTSANMPADMPADMPAPVPIRQDFVGSYDPRIPAGGTIKPLQLNEFNGLNARPEEVNGQFACPYPGCDKFYSLLGGVDRHLRRDHPDWALAKDKVIGPDSK
jgi:hypothetical protein